MDEKLASQLQRLSKALSAFESAVAEDDGDAKSRNSLLLCFVFTFEMACKTLHAALLVRGVDAPNYAVAILKSAFRARLVTDASGWEMLRDHRNNVSHAYDEGLAVEIAAFVRDNAAPLFHQLIERVQRDD